MKHASFICECETFLKYLIGFWRESNGFVLLHRELQDGTLKDNGIVEGSKVVLTPNVETGLLVSLFNFDF